MASADSAFGSGIAGMVGNGRENRTADVIWAKTAMHRLGRYNDRGERHGYIDRELHEAIEGYQRDRGLRSDAWMRPGGQTEQARGWTSRDSTKSDPDGELVRLDT